MKPPVWIDADQPYGKCRLYADFVPPLRSRCRMQNEETSSHSAFSIQHCTAFNIQHSAFCILHSAFRGEPPTRCPPHAVIPVTLRRRDPVHTPPDIHFAVPRGAY